VGGGIGSPPVSISCVWRSGASCDYEGGGAAARDVHRVAGVGKLEVAATAGGFSIDFPVASGHDSAHY